MRIILHASIQVLLIGLFIYMAYLPTIEMKFFPWGDTRYSGEFKIILVVLLPLTLFLIALSRLLNRGRMIPWYLKISWIYYLTMLSLYTFILLSAESDAGYWASVIVPLIAVLIIITESYFTYNTSKSKTETLTGFLLRTSSKKYSQ